MKVPLLDLAAQAKSVEADVKKAVLAVLDSQRYVLGPEVEALEGEIAAYCGAKHGVAVRNGSDALVMSLMALGIGPGDEVIVPTFTFFATAGSVARVGAKPVMVDVLPDTFNIDPDATAAAVTARTKAIIPVHLYGQCADMDRLMAIASRHGLAVIEDAAQAIGAKRHDRGVASYGTLATLSFYPTKNLSAVGEGGMILTNDGELAARLRCFRNHGQTGTYEHAWIGGNFRLDGIQGAALRVKLRKLPDWNEGRRKNAERYDAGLKDTDVVTPVAEACSYHVYHQYTIRSPRRDALREHLKAAEIDTGVYYPLPLHLQPCFAYLGYQQGAMPVAERLSTEVLSLPIYPEMSREQQDHVIETIRSFSRAS
ncbi:MAG TPA: DegT/DnrJ/EryC1/StrS family aminotransferase [Phycisphaerae bacterium]|nr:DegT/DnrJ/EryC1/StrS family aminotransferase [Phycisphaerae bacterium]